jgi:hypothetical protein
MSEPAKVDAVPQISVRRPPWFLIHSVCGALFLLFIIGAVSWIKGEKVLSGNADFTIFYTAARLLRDYPTSGLYNLEIQSRVQRQVLGDYVLAGGLLPYNHPPFEVFLFLPLGCLSYAAAFLVWFGVNLGAIFCLPWAIARMNPAAFNQRRVTLLLTALAFYPFFVCLIQGQDSILFLWCVIWAFLLIREGREFWSGVVIGLAFFKFHIAFFLIVPLILKRRGRELAGLTCSLAGLTLVSTLWIGPVQIRSYMGLLLKMGAAHDQLGFTPEKFQNWIGQLYLLGLSGFHSLFGTLVIGLLALLVLYWIWRGEWKACDTNFGLRVSATLMVALLASPHVYIHDLSILFLTLCLLLEFLLFAGRDSDSTLLVMLLACSPFVLIFSLPLSREIPIQLSVVWMSAMLFIILAILRRSPDKVRLA